MTTTVAAPSHRRGPRTSSIYSRAALQLPYQLSRWGGRREAVGPPERTVYPDGKRLAAQLLSPLYLRHGLGHVLGVPLYRDPDDDAL